MAESRSHSNVILKNHISLVIGKELQPGKNDVVFVYASVTDAYGTVIPDDKRAIKFTVEGDATFIGNNPRNAEAGISTILLKTSKKQGVLHIKATAEGLVSGEINLNLF